MKLFINTNKKFINFISIKDWSEEFILVNSNSYDKYKKNFLKNNSDGKYDINKLKDVCKINYIDKKIIIIINLNEFLNKRKKIYEYSFVEHVSWIFIFTKYKKEKENLLKIKNLKEWIYKKIVNYH